MRFASRSIAQTRTNQAGAKGGSDGGLASSRRLLTVSPSAARGLGPFEAPFHQPHTWSHTHVRCCTAMPSRGSGVVLLLACGVTPLSGLHLRIAHPRCPPPACMAQGDAASRAAILQAAKQGSAVRAEQKRERGWKPDEAEQRYRVPQYDQAIDGVTVSNPRGEQLIVKLQTHTRMANVRAAKAKLDKARAEWIAPPTHRAALEFIDLVGDLHEAQSYVAGLSDESALLGPVSSRFGPQPLLERVVAHTASPPPPDAESDESSAQDVDTSDAAEERTPISAADLPAIWRIFTSAVRALLVHKRALASSDGSSRGWRTSVEWRLLQQMDGLMSREAESAALELSASAP